MTQEIQNTDTRYETHKWHETYRSDVLTRRRLATHGKKLKRLGVLSEQRDVRILDLCCGEGEMLDILVREGFTELIGADLVSETSWCKKISGKPWKYVAGAATHFPFMRETFDWVICAHSLHHLWPVKNIEWLISEAQSVLKPGGRLAIIDHYDSWQMRLVFAMILSPFAFLTSWTKAFREQHLEEKEIMMGYLADWPKVRNMIESAGFSSVSVKKRLFFFYCVAKK